MVIYRVEKNVIDFIFVIWLMVVVVLLDGLIVDMVFKNFEYFYLYVWI